MIKTPETMNASYLADESGLPRLARIKRVANSYMITHMLGSERPDHTRLRAVVAEPFAPRALSARIPRMTAIADGLVAQMNPAQPVDLATVYAVPLPVRNIAEMLGIPATDEAAISRASALLGDVLCSSNDELRSAALIFARLLLPSMALRSVVPRDDLLGILVREYRRGGMTLREAVSTAALLLIAGHEAVTSLILNTTLNLLLNPTEMDRVRADPDALTPVIEETLRRDAPQPVATLRVAGEPITLEDKKIAAGEWLLISVLAAGNDPHANEFPAAFDSARKPRRHISFGHGIHTCLGAQLARIETRIAVTQLLARYPKISLAADPDDLPIRRSVFFRRLESLPVHLGTA